jgi:hypothetical protein
LGRVINYIKDWFKNLSGEEKRRFALVCTAGFSVLLTFSVIIYIRGTGEEKQPFEPERVKLNIVIPADELFFPDEPDFLPGVLLERDRRSSWTEQDALEHWQNPLISGEEQWREKIESAIDAFLERVP